MNKIARGNIPTVPVTVVIDPTNRCNQKCVWCISGDLTKRDDMLEEDYLTGLVEELWDIGVKGIEFAGGGEPMLNPATIEAVKLREIFSIDMGMITNGNYDLHPTAARVLAENLRWIGFSVDAYDEKSFKKVHGVKGFNLVLTNINIIANIAEKKGTPCEVAYKYLIHEDNYDGIYTAVEKAKELGVKQFHCRPLHRSDAYPDEVVQGALDRLQKAREDFEDESFGVFGIQHKFTNDWWKSLPFEKCRATPLIAVVMADKNLCVCCDRRESETLHVGKITSPGDFVKLWGSTRHKKVLENINISECPRCIFTFYNELIEKAILRDGMCKNFV